MSTDTRPPHHPTPREAAAEEPARPKIDLSLTQVLAGALAAMTAAYLGSRLSVAGTVVGAAVASVVAAVARRLEARVLVEAANGPTTLDADPVLEERGVVVVPDILANAGGVTASYFEWAQNRQGYAWEEQVVADRLRRQMEQAFAAVWERARDLDVPLRRAAFVVAVERVAEAIEARGLFP